MARDNKSTALAFYNNTYECDHKQYLSTLAQKTAPFEEIRSEYFKLFDWDESILGSLRTLTQKLFFRAESQHIDTILEAFADSWTSRFSSTTTFGNANGVYLVSYSLILLNTDLHTQDVNAASSTPSALRPHIGQADYVKNTVQALTSNDIKLDNLQSLETVLNGYYEELARNELKLFTNTSLDPAKSNKALDDTNSVYSRDSFSAFASPSLASKSFGFASALATERASSSNGTLKKQNSRESLGSTFTSSQATVYTSQLSNLNEIDNESELESHLQLQDSLHNLVLEEEGDLELELDGPPWIKEGLANVVMIDVDQDLNKQVSKFNFLRSARQQPQVQPTYNTALQKWKNAFIVISKGELRLFSFESGTGSIAAANKAKQKRFAFGRSNGSGGVAASGLAAATNFSNLPVVSDEPLGAGNWYDNANCLAVFQLSQTYASKPTQQALNSVRSQVRASPAKKMGDSYWSLTLPLQNSTAKRHTKLIFQCGSDDVSREFIESCNFWAARTSNVPSENATMSSFEYGWSNKLVKLVESLESASDAPARAAVVRELNAMKVVDWSPLATSNLPTNLVMTDQLTKLQNYYRALRSQLEEHEAVKGTLESLLRFQKGSRAASRGASAPVAHQSSSFSFRRRPPPVQTPSTQTGARTAPQTVEITLHARLIMNNYNKKSNYLNRETLKYRKYLNSLTNAIKLRREKLREQAAQEEGDTDTISLNSLTKKNRPDTDDDDLLLNGVSEKRAAVARTTTADYDDDAFGTGHRIIKIGVAGMD